jgi:hypothetical protein
VGKRGLGMGFRGDPGLSDSLEIFKGSRVGGSLAPVDGEVARSLMAEWLVNSAVEKSGGKVVVLLDTVKAGKRPGVEIIHILMYTLFGEQFAFLKPIGPV